MCEYGGDEDDDSETNEDDDWEEWKTATMTKMMLTNIVTGRKIIYILTNLSFYCPIYEKTPAARPAIPVV